MSETTENQVEQAGTTEAAVTGPSETKDLTARVQEIIDEIRPFLQSDGGDCELLKVEDNVAYVRLVGACVGCPSSTMTLRMGVENRIRESIPEIEAVEMI